MSAKLNQQKKRVSLLTGCRDLIPWKRIFFVSLLFAVLTIGTSVFFFVMEGKRLMDAQSEISQRDTSGVVQEPEGVFDESDTFPISVDPDEKIIAESPKLGEFISDHVEPTDGVLSSGGWFGKVLGRLALMGWYQNLASLSSRLLVIEPGERKEEVAQHFAKILGWNTSEKREFIELVQSTKPILEEGKFFPGTVTVPKDAGPSEVAVLVHKNFKTEVYDRYTSEIEEMVPLSDALTIASLLEREARDFDDMRHISGIIWNRLFLGMKLQIDATLQYAKGSSPRQAWWPRVLPSDKFLTSEYNTYAHEGLPPAPISNPSLAAIIAALNPIGTDCLFYFHDRKGGFHCSSTYEEHVKLLKQFYGRGK